MPTSTFSDPLSVADTSSEFATTGKSVISEKNSFASIQTLVQSVKSLHATPIDGLITSLLFVSIAFMTVKIARRY